MTRQSLLESGGINLFQEIKEVCRRAEESGQTLYRLSIGQPTGPAFLAARTIAADAILSDDQEMHEYQDNGSPGVPDFAKRFVQAHVRTDLEKESGIAYLPIPGIKPMLGLIPLACGLELDEHLRYALTMTEPGYPTPTDWCGYLSVLSAPVILNVENQFLFSFEELELSSVCLSMTNYPHNPSGQVATRQWWEKICSVAEEKGVRIFNDAAYAMLAHSSDHCTLADVAVDFHELSWAEAFSASKAGNFTGWRVGAIVGSSDFVGDIATIKGNSDSGLVAPLAVGVLDLFEKHRDLIAGVQRTYNKRMERLINILKDNGMRLAVEPKAGFFTLWQVPSVAFGQRITDAKHFNYLMIERTGVVGVHFDPYVRYAVCSDIELMADSIYKAFRDAKVAYDDWVI